MHPLWQKSIPSQPCHERVLPADLRALILTLAGPGAVNAAAKVNRRWRSAANGAYDWMVSYCKLEGERVLLLKVASQCDTKNNPIRPTKAKIKEKHANCITQQKRNKRDEVREFTLKKLQKTASRFFVPARRPPK